MKRAAGNALFLILIAVALFAALSYAVTRSGRGGGTIQKEQSLLAASQIMQYVSGIRYAVQKLTVNGCTQTQLSFEPPPYTGAGPYFNAASPTDYSCHIFHPNGGGQIPWTYKAELQGAGVYGPYATPIYNATWGVSGIGSNGADLTFIIGLTDKSMCTSINLNVGVNNPSGNPPHRDGSHIHVEFNGAYTDPYPGWADWSSAAGADTTLDPGHMDACMNYFDREASLYIFYSVLLPR